MTMDPQKIRRETQRWNVMQALYNARPIGAYEELVLAVIRALFPDATQHEARLALDYLADRDLVTLSKQPDGRWFAELNRHGVDVVEYTVDCEPGIARPAKYW